MTLQYRPLAGVVQGRHTGHSARTSVGSNPTPGIGHEFQRKMVADVWALPALTREFVTLSRSTLIGKETGLRNQESGFESLLRYRETHEVNLCVSSHQNPLGMVGWVSL